MYNLSIKMRSIVVLHYAEIGRPNWLLLKKAAQKRNVQLISWQPQNVQMYCKDKKCVPLYDGQEVSPPIILHRTQFPFSGVVLPALDYWASNGTLVLNAPEYAFRSRDKLLTTMVLCKAGIPVVPTLGFVRSGDKDFSMLGDTPIIIKPAHGLRGEGIELFSSPKDVVMPKDSSNNFLPLEHYVAQPFINTGGRDIRAYVVNGKCIALMERQARKGEFRANISQGARGTSLPASHPASNIAVTALKACQLDYGGVDMIEDKDGVTRVLEVSAWAGFAGISVVTGADVAGAILEMACKEVQRR